MALISNIRYFLVALSMLTVLHGAEHPELRAAAKAMKDQLPEVALAKLTRLLETAKLPAETRLLARIRCAEAAVRAGNFDKAVEVATPLKSGDPPELAFWKAAALQAKGAWAEAAAVYASLPTQATWQLSTEASFNRSATLSALGDHTAAFAALEPIEKISEPNRLAIWRADLYLRQKKYADALQSLNSLAKLTPAQKAQSNFLKGRILLERGEAAPATAILSEVVVVDKGISNDLHQAALLVLARAQRVAGDRDSAVRTVVDLMGKLPQPALVTAAFQEFHQCNSPPDAELEKMLVSWAATGHPQISAEATAALMDLRSAGNKIDVALELGTKFASAHPTTPWLTDILLRKTRLLIASGKGTEAMEILSTLDKSSQPAAVRAWVAEMRAYAGVKSGDFAMAATAFQSAASTIASPEKKLLAAYNAATASLQAGRPDEVDRVLTLLGSGQAAELQADLFLERALFAAGKGETQAEQMLTNFLAQFPEHDRAFDAALAVAEISSEKFSGSPDTVRGKIAQARNFAKKPDQLERVEILSLHVDSLSASLETYSKSVDGFLAKHGESEFGAELLMKLAVRYYTSQRYAEAKARFLKVVETDPESPLVDAARFFAGKAALGSLAKGCEEEALKLWDQVAKGKSEFRSEARLEQAKLDQRRDPAAALQILDALKAEPTLGPTMRYSVLCLRGETLVATYPDKPEKVRDALKCFDEVIQSAAPDFWKQQAMVRKGTCQETLNDEPGAIESYYEAMNLTPSGEGAEADYHWFFRAGEKAMRLLEAKSNWKASVAIARKLSEAPGPQATVARERANRLITEHFLAEED